MSLLPRLFVVGCPRSGTTLLQSFFAAHPDIASFPETHFFYRILLRRRFGVHLVDAGAAYARAEKFLAKVDRLDLLRLMPTASRPDPSAPRRGLARRSVRAFARVLDHITADDRAKTWVEKTPMHLRIHEPLARLLGQPILFVHIVRDGHDTAASLYDAVSARPDAWGGAKTAAECADRWADDVERTRQAIRHDHHTVVFYEDLVAHPEAEMRRLCTWAGLSFDPQMVERRAEAADRLITPSERRSHKGDYTREVKAPSRRKFETVFTEAEQVEVAGRVERVDLGALYSTVLPKRSHLGAPASASHE